MVHTSISHSSAGTAKAIPGGATSDHKICNSATPPNSSASRFRQRIGVTRASAANTALAR